MARPSATTALLLLVLSLLAVAHCRTVAVAADHAAEPESTAAVAVSDDNGLSPNPTLPAEAGASAADEEALPVPAEQRHEFLRLPSHRLHHHRPCSHHHHLWWKRHHGVYRDAPRRFHDHFSGHGERREAVSHLAILPAEEAEEAKSVAEPDPDRSLPLPDSDGREPSTSFADADGHDDEGAAAVRAWKKEMLRRWFHIHFHHGMRRHRLHHVHHDEEEGQEQEEETAPERVDMKRFHFHHHDDEEDEEKNMARKWLRHAEHGEDSDDEDEQVEELVRRFRKAIMRRRFGHGRRFFHHDHMHRHDAEEAEKQAAGGDEQSGVVAWIKGLMNRF